MKRRELFWTPAVLLAGCGGDVAASKRIPWNLWGSKETLSIESNGFVLGGASSQLARINYKRPETWSFFLGGRIISGPVSGVPATFVEVIFQLAFGVGRDRFSSSNQPATGAVEGFLRLRWDVAAGVVPGRQAGNNKWASQVLSPILEDDIGASSQRVVNHITAQDIQCNADVRVLSQAGAPVVVEVFSFFAPRTHIRPDWFMMEGDPFAGEETQGT